MAARVERSLRHERPTIPVERYCDFDLPNAAQTRLVSSRRASDPRSRTLRGKAPPSDPRVDLPDLHGEPDSASTSRYAASRSTVPRTATHGKTSLPSGRRRDDRRGLEASVAAVYPSLYSQSFYPQIAANRTATCFTTKAARCSLMPNAKPMSLYRNP